MQPDTWDQTDLTQTCNVVVVETEAEVKGSNGDTRSLTLELNPPERHVSEKPP